MHILPPSLQRKCEICKAPLPPHTPHNAQVCQQLSCRQKRQLNQLQTRAMCRFCGDPIIGGHGSKDVCERPDCKRAALHESLAEGQRQLEEAFLQRMQRRKETLAANLGLPPEALHMAQTPVNLKELIPLEETRKQSFQANLEALFDELLANAESNPNTADEAPAENPPPTQAPFTFNHTNEWLAQLCRNCLGWCCQTGDDHAYIKKETLLFQLTQEPTLTPQTLLQSYLNKIPNEAYKDSCLFHTNTGCALPAKMRSATCHHYHCGGLQKLIDAPLAPEVAFVFAVATEKTQPRRLACFDQESFHDVPLSPENGDISIGEDTK